MMSTIALLVFPIAMAWAASSDLLTMRISNKLVLVIAGSFFLVALLVGLPLAQVGLHIACAALVLAVAFGCFAMGWIGGGDAKFGLWRRQWTGLISSKS